MANKKFEFDTDGFKYYHDTYVKSPINSEKSRAQSAESTLNGKVSALETAVGSGGSVDSRIAAAKAEIKGNATSACDTLGEAEALINDRYTKSETYTKTEVNGLVDTPHQNYVTVATYASLPASGSADTIYRVSNYNGSTSQVDVTSYSEYAWNGSSYTFLCVKSQIGEVFDISVYNNNAKYADLAAALNGGANIPQSLQKGGMSVKFVQSSDNKYVQYRYISTSTANDDFTNIANWQGIEDIVIPQFDVNLDYQNYLPNLAASGSESIVPYTDTTITVDGNQYKVKYINGSETGHRVQASLSFDSVANANVPARFYAYIYSNSEQSVSINLYQSDYLLEEEYGLKQGWNTICCKYLFTASQLESPVIVQLVVNTSKIYLYQFIGYFHEANPTLFFEHSLNEIVSKFKDIDFLAEPSYDTTTGTDYASLLVGAGDNVLPTITQENITKAGKTYTVQHIVGNEANNRVQISNLSLSDTAIAGVKMTFFGFIWSDSEQNIELKIYNAQQGYVSTNQVTLRKGWNACNVSHIPSAGELAHNYYIQLYVNTSEIYLYKFIASFDGMPVKVISEKSTNDLSKDVNVVENNLSDLASIDNARFTSPNLLNKNAEDVALNTFIYGNDIQENELYNTTGFIKVSPNTTYVFNDFDSSDYGYLRVINFYDFGKNIISYINNTEAPEHNYFATPNGCEYLRVVLFKFVWNDRIQLEKGSTPTKYIEYPGVLKLQCVPELPHIKSFYSLDSDSLTLSGSAVRNADKTISIGGGSSNKAFINALLQCWHWSMSVKVNFSSGTPHIRLGKDDSTSGSWIDVRNDNGVSYIDLYNVVNHSGSNYPDVIKTYTLPFVISLNEDYYINIQSNIGTLKVWTVEIYGQYDEYYTFTTSDIEPIPTMHGEGKPFVYSTATSCLIKEFVWTIQNYYDVKNARAGIFGHSMVGGDSLSSDRIYCFANLLAEAIGEKKFINFGLGGLTVAQLIDMLNNLKPFLKNIEYGMIAIGGNDYYMDSSYIISKTQECIAILEEAGVVPILFTEHPMPVQGGIITSIREYNAWIRNSGYLYVDEEQVFLDVDAITGNPTNSNIKTDLYLSDNTHPTIQGHEDIFHRVKMDCPFLF